jgi:hypothetical protein
MIRKSVQRLFRKACLGIIEWQTTRNVGGVRFEWRGVDKFRLRDGKIAEEVVYSDTAPLRAFRSGEKLEPITKF